MRRTLLLATAFLSLWAGPAHAADCRISIAPLTGRAPLTVSLAVTDCEAAAVRWSFGDGGRAEGPTVTHTYGAGRWGQSVEVSTLDGVVSHYDLLPVTAYRIALARPARVLRYGDSVSFRGTAAPVTGGIVTVDGVRARWIAPGVFSVRLRVRKPGPHLARYGGVASNPVWVLVRPALEARLEGSSTVGSRLALRVRLRPAGAGTLRIRVGRRLVRLGRGGHIELDTSRPRTIRVVVSILPGKGFTGPGRILVLHVVEPSLAVGSRGPAVRALEGRLVALRYALPGADGVYDQRTAEAVTTFQGVHGLAPTGRVDPQLWRLLERAQAPAARYPGNHVEVDRTRQVLFLVRGGRVVLAVHVSTGATGNTPLGLWHVYRKVPGWSWVLWYPSYFLRGFAIHGYPDVPSYPASHGCVRVPMWIATGLYQEIPNGSAIYIYA